MRLPKTIATRIHRRRQANRSYKKKKKSLLLNRLETIPLIPHTATTFIRHQPTTKKLSATKRLEITIQTTTFDPRRTSEVRLDHLEDDKIIEHTNYITFFLKVQRQRSGFSSLEQKYDRNYYKHNQSSMWGRHSTIKEDK
jgi:hypothetical protein